MNAARVAFMALLVVTTSACACQTRPGEDRAGGDPSPSGSRPVAGGVAPQDHGDNGRSEPPPVAVSVPVAVPATSGGHVTPAPWLADAERVAIVHLRGRPYVAFAGPGWLRVATPAGTLVAEARGRGAAQVLVDLGESAERVWLGVGRGISRHDRKAPVSASLYAFDGRSLTEENIGIPASSRAQVLFMGRAGNALAGNANGEVAGAIDDLWVAAFQSKYFASVLRVKRVAEGFDIAERDRIRVPLGLALGDPDGDLQSDLFIARPYGEDKDEPGDVFRWLGPKRRDLLPTVRGARAVAVHGAQVVVADGWHRDYGRRAQALLTRIWRERDGWHSQVLVHVAGRHGYDRLAFGHIDGDEHIDLIAAGDGPAIAVRNLAPVSDAAMSLGSIDARDVAVGDLAGDGVSSRRHSVVIAGPEPGIWRLASRLERE